MVSVLFEFIRGEFQQFLLDRQRVLARCESGAIGNAEDMRIDSNGWFAESDVQHHIRGFASDARQCLKRFAVSGDFAAMLIEQYSAGGDDIFCFGAVEAYAFDERFQSGHPQFAQTVRSIGFFE